MKDVCSVIGTIVVAVESRPLVSVVTDMWSAAFRTTIDVVLTPSRACYEADSKCFGLTLFRKSGFSILSLSFEDSIWFSRRILQLVRVLGVQSFTMCAPINI